MNTMRVGFVMEQVLGHVSHYQTLRRVVDQMSDVDPRWVEVTYAGDGLLEKLPMLPRGASGTARGYLQVREGLRGVRPDALFFHTEKPAVFQWDRLARVPTVLSLDVTPLQYDALGEHYDHQPDGDTPVARFKHWLNVRTFAMARSIVVWSTWVKDSLVADYGVADAKVHVIPPGVDLRLWQATDRSERSELPRILFVGGDFERKGGNLLLDWFRRAGRGRCELDIVTRAPLTPEPGVRMHRNITGNSPESRRLFAGADIFVLPSLGECFGIASVEAMAAGLPVITTRVGGSPDIVVTGETGFLIEPDAPGELRDGLERLLTDNATRVSMGRRGRARAEQLFDGVANARRVVACISEVCTLLSSSVRPAPERMEFPRRVLS